MISEDEPLAHVDAAAGGPEVSALRVRNVEKHFRGVYALKDVSLDVRRGEIHAVVGENGAGKSTLMALVAGSLKADSGSIEIAGTRLNGGRPDEARDLGVAIAYQEPALVPDLTVAENVFLGLPPRLRPRPRERRARIREILAGWRPGGELDPDALVRALPPDERFLVEIARGLAEQPSLLILDEPTEHLLAEDVARLFARVRELAAAGGTVIYISHRINEVKQIADRITVLRDGSVRGTFDTAEVSEADVVALIVGRAVSARFPRKGDGGGRARLHAHGLHARRLRDIDLAARAGEIVGLAGVENQGQRDLLRTLAGIDPGSGEVQIDGRATGLRSVRAAADAGIAYIPGDRHSEGLFPALSVRENLTVRALARLARAGLVSGARERAAAQRERVTFGIKAPELEARVDELSGGNQQKVVVARALSGEPAIVLADEPTQGVDIGARAEIYQILRAAADRGACVLVKGAENAELAGLCDRVLVLSRGAVVAELAGADVTEASITSAVIGAAASARQPGQESRGVIRPHRLLASDRSPALVLLLLIALLGTWGASADSSYLSAISITSLLTLFAALGFIALGQQLVMLTAGIDLSVGPLAGLLVVVGSFVLAENRTPLGLAIGIAVIAAAAVTVGLVNWTLVFAVRIDPMIATLVSYTALQGLSLLLRPQPGGTIAQSLADTVNKALGPVPLAAVIAAVVGVVLEVGLRRWQWGWRLRAVGSLRAAATRMGVRPPAVLLAAYIGCALLTLLGALMLMGQVGSGDPSAGISYTFDSVAAVVLGGASIFGGRGSFIGALGGALLVVQIDTVAVFVHLSDAVQQYLLGGLTLVAVGLYSRMRAVRA